MRAQTIAECTNHPDSPRRGIMENSSTALLRVLIVDDDDAFRAALIEFLQMRSRHVRSCKDGQEAIRVLREEKEPFDVVITDLIMPLVGGIEVIRAAKERYAETQVVVITGFATLETAIDAMRQGAYDYIAKPFKLVEVDLIVEKISERKKLMEENQKLTERVQSLYTRLDLLKDNRSKLDRFINETTQQLEQHAHQIDECLDLIKKVSLQLDSSNSPSRLLMRQ
jgi:DNA-binding NtrC family response regulator